MGSSKEVCFSLESGTLPGLGKIVEEAGEVLQIAGKLHAAPNSSRLREQLWNELGDLLAAVEFTVSIEGTEGIVETRRTQKLRRYRKRRRQTLSDPDTVPV